jgi:hypothetical protein
MTSWTGYETPLLSNVSTVPPVCVTITSKDEMDVVEDKVVLNLKNCSDIRMVIDFKT